jgi:alpha-beta hydrolase superfamily lysophospholipase
MFQHNPPFWYPAENVQTPLLWLAGESDAVVGVMAEQRSAAHYGATFRVYPEAAHNLMMEPNHRAIALDIHEWLVAQQIG